MVTGHFLTHGYRYTHMANAHLQTKRLPSLQFITSKLGHLYHPDDLWTILTQQSWTLVAIQPNPQKGEELASNRGPQTSRKGQIVNTFGVPNSRVSVAKTWFYSYSPNQPEIISNE